MTFTRSFDYRLIGEIMRHPKVWVADDFSGTREEFQPREDAAIHYVVVADEQEILGLFILAPQSTVCWEIHTRLLPSAWGKQAAEALEGILEWAWRNLPCRRIVTTVPEFNRLALRYGYRGGFTLFGFNPASYQKNGKLYGQFLLGVSKPEYDCRETDTCHL